MKRSLTIDGHATSISLEDEFWDELQRIASSDGQSLAKLVAQVDAQRWQGDREARGLSSSLRIFILNRMREDAERMAPTGEL